MEGVRSYRRRNSEIEGSDKRGDIEDAAAAGEGGEVRLTQDREERSRGVAQRFLDSQGARFGKSWFQVTGDMSVQYHRDTKHLEVRCCFAPNRPDAVVVLSQLDQKALAELLWGLSE